jgi:hypothetical protein
MLKSLLSGFFVKIVAGFDVLTRISIMTNVAKTKKGKLAFILGVLFIVTLMIIFSFFFGSILKRIPYSNYISAGLIFLLAIFIQFNVFFEKPKKKTEKKLVHYKPVFSKKKFFKLIFIGSLATFATIIDDTIAYTGLFASKITNNLFIIIGIFLAVSLEILMMIYFSDKLMRLKYRKEITSIGLIILAILIAIGIL